MSDYPTASNSAAGDIPGTAPLGGKDARATSIRPEPGIVLQGQKARYRLLERLGSGGFGSVFRAIRETTGNILSDAGQAIPEILAIKVYHSSGDGGAADNLRRELNSLLAFHHPGIPPVYDWMVGPQLSFIALHFYPRGSLQDARHLMPRMETSMALRLLQDLLSALVVAHRANILHLDIKPANILIGDDGRFILTDFGISQGMLVSWHLVQPGLGTVGYHSPEQRNLEEEKIGARTDLWGVGATVYSLYTGKDLTVERSLFKGHEPKAVHGFPPVTDFRSDCPRPLSRFIMSLLAIQPDDRPPMAAAALASLRQTMLEEATGGPDEATQLDLRRPGPEETQRLLLEILDPLWAEACQAPGFHRHLALYADGECLMRQGDASYTAFVLLGGTLRVERNGNVIARETRHGAFIGEVAALTGYERTASVYAEGNVLVATFNASELEKLIVCNPAAGIRLVRTLAERLAARSHDNTR